MVAEQATRERKYSWISHDVTAAMLVSPNNEMVSMLVSRSNPPGIESYYYANVFFFFSLKNMAVDHVSETQEYSLNGIKNSNP